MAPPLQNLVLDSNIVLDMLLFDSPTGAALLAAIEAGPQAQWAWIASAPMLQEFTRVLAYPHIAKRCAFYAKSADSLVFQYQRLAHIVEPGQRAPYRCKDPDDQIFIDLAYSYRAQLLSKDRAVLALKNRMARHGLRIASELA